MKNSQTTELADYARRLHARGWVANHDGNITARLPNEQFLATPTSTSKADVTAERLLVVDGNGAKVSGQGNVFSEISLHLAVYRARPDVQAIVHAHPPTATGFAVAGVALERAFIAEALVSLGADVPLVPFGAPGPGAVQALLPFLIDHDAVMLTGHGVLAWGNSIEQAFLRMELVEHLCKISLVARQLGGAKALPAAVVPGLLEARKKAGFGAAGRGVTGTPVNNSGTGTPRIDTRPVVIACAPPPSDAPVRLAEPRSRALPNSADLATIIRQEIVNALKK